MEDKLTIGSLIKRHIKMRGRTVKEVSEALGRNYTTFSGILNRDVVDAKLLFELANLLDIDLVWMAELFDHKKSISSFAQYQLPRMQSDFRKHDYTEGPWLRNHIPGGRHSPPCCLVCFPTEVV